MVAKTDIVRECNLSLRIYIMHEAVVSFTGRTNTLATSFVFLKLESELCHCRHLLGLSDGKIITSDIFLFLCGRFTLSCWLFCSLSSVMMPASLLLRDSKISQQSKVNSAEVIISPSLKCKNHPRLQFAFLHFCSLGYHSPGRCQSAKLQ